MSKEFAVSRMRIDRAAAHRVTLANTWNLIPPENLFEPSARVAPNGKGSIFIVSKNPIPEDFPLLIGEILYQLRSALDACIYQAAIYSTGQDPPPGGDKSEFPITLSREEFKGKDRKLADLPEKMKEFIEELQPYNTPTLPPEELILNLNHSLWLLNDLARKDRHRKLHVFGSWPLELKPDFDVPDGVTVATKIVHHGFLEPVTELATIELTGYVSGMRVRACPNLVTMLSLKEGPVPYCPSDSFDSRLTEMINAVHSVICAFEEYF